MSIGGAQCRVLPVGPHQYVSYLATVIQGHKAVLLPTDADCTHFVPVHFFEGGFDGGETALQCQSSLFTAARLPGAYRVSSRQP